MVSYVGETCGVAGATVTRQYIRCKVVLFFGANQEMKTNCQTSQIYSSMAGDEDLADLVEVFVGEIPNRVEALNAAASLQDWKSVERYAHQLKGALGSYGFGTVMPFAQDLEAITREGKPEAEIVAALKQLESMCERISSGSCCQ